MPIFVITHKNKDHYDNKEDSLQVTDFEMIRKEDYYFVDKTRYVEVLEKTARFFFLIRPRRFRKIFVYQHA